MIEVHRLKNIVIFIQRIINFYSTNTEPEQLKVSKNSCHINIDNLKFSISIRGKTDGENPNFKSKSVGKFRKEKKVWKTKPYNNENIEIYKG